MRFIDRSSTEGQPPQPRKSVPDTTPRRTARLQDRSTPSGLTSSRNPDGRGPWWHGAVGILSWGALSFAAILFVGADNPGKVFDAWVLAIFLGIWIVTALTARTVRRIPTRHKGQNHGQHR